MKKKSGEIPSRRRNPRSRVGFVNFPTKDSTGEGGNFVRLVVLDTKGDKEYMRRYVPCCGGYVSFHMDDCFVGDDLRDEQIEKLGPEPTWDRKTDKGWPAYHRHMKKVEKLSRENELRYFPGLYGENHDDPNRYMSRAFLAVMTIGATGWSGSWRATYKDLTREGKDLYRSFQKLYPGCEIRLLSFLDT
jgi:hypothetical protein